MKSPETGLPEANQAPFRTRNWPPACLFLGQIRIEEYQNRAQWSSTCYERQLSPSFESPELLEFLDCPWEGRHRKGRYGFTGRAHLSGHLRECHGAASLPARRLQRFDRSGQQIIQSQGGCHSTSQIDAQQGIPRLSEAQMQA
jgi:hypothetical protein